MLTPTVETSTAGAPPESRSIWKKRIGRSRVGLLDVALFAEQFRALISAGIPVTEALSLLARSTESGAPALAETLEAIRWEVEDGASLGEAFRRYESVFGRLAVELIATGETTGTLERTLQDLAEDCEHRHRNRATFVSALVEPILIVVLGLVVAYILVTVSVPQFKALFDGLAHGAPLPLPTRIVIAVSDMLTSPLGIAATAVGAGLFAACILVVARSKRAKYHVHRALLRVPLVGGIALLDAVGRAARTLGVVHRSIGDIPLGLELAARTTTNLRVAEALDTVAEDVYDGRMLWEAMRDTEVIPELAVFMTKSGEESGQLDTLLAKLADTYETTVRYRRERLLTVLRYSLLLVMGGFVLFVMLAMYLPVFSLIDRMRG